MSKRIDRLRVPFYEEQARRAAEAIRCGHLVYGPHLDELRTQLAARFGKRHVTLTANGFAALFVALKTCMPAAAQVLTSPASTCRAMTNAIRAAGGTPIFDDFDFDTASLGRGAALAARNTLAVIPDHFGVIAAACREWPQGNPLLIEDAAQAFVSRSSVPTAARIVTLSFYPSKLVNGIDGGALLTDDAQLHAAAERLVQYADQREEEAEARFNLKMNNVNAAVALATLEQLPQAGERLRAIQRAYARGCERSGLACLKTRGEELASRFMVLAASAADKREWLRRAEAAGVQASEELALLCTPSQAVAYPVASDWVERSFSLPFHPLLDDADVERVLALIERA